MNSLLYDIIENKQAKELYFELGLVLVSQKKFSKSLEFLLTAKETIGTKPEEWLLYYSLGEVYRNLNNDEDAFINLIEAALKSKDHKYQVYEEAEKLIYTVDINKIKNRFEKITKNASSLTKEDKKALKELKATLKNLTSLPILISDNNPLPVYNTQIQKEINELIFRNKYNDALRRIESIPKNNLHKKELLFIKIRILIEGQIDLTTAKILFNDEDFGYRKNSLTQEILDQVITIISDNQVNGNSYFFAAFVGNLLKIDKKTLDEWLNKAEILALTTENPKLDSKLGLYLLKAEIAENDNSPKDAAINFFAAAKCYYNAGNYSEAEKYFRKTISLDIELYEAFIYQADALYILSERAEPPYYDEQRINDAYNAWQKWSGVVEESTQAWYYIVIARICEVRYKFRQLGAVNEYWQAILFGERALIHDKSSYSIWGHLGGFHGNVGLKQNSLFCLETSQALYKNDYFYEQKIMALLNKGDFDEPKSYLLSLEQGKVEDKGTTLAYLPYHKTWRAYILYHQRNFGIAARLLGSVLEEEPKNLWARQVKMLCHWSGKQFIKSKEEAKIILELKAKYNYLKEENSFAWAYFLTGETEKAITILEESLRYNNESTDHANSLCQFYLHIKDIEKAKQQFSKFIYWRSDPHNLCELKFNIKALRSWILADQDSSAVIKEWENEIDQKINSLNSFKQTEINELENFQTKNGFDKGTLPYIAIKAGLARLHQNKNNLQASYGLYKELASLKEIEISFPEVQTTITQIENEIFKQVEDYTKNLPDDFQEKTLSDEVIINLEEFDLEASTNEWKKYILLSFAYFAKNNRDKSFTHLKKIFNLSKHGYNFHAKFWEYITGQLYSAKLTWSFVHFLKKNLDELGSPDASIMQDSMADNLWNVLINKESNALNPIFTPISVEISNNLVPEETDTDHWNVFTEMIPAMRDRIVQRYGIKPPGVRIRGNDGTFVNDTYVISLDEVPLVMGTVQSGKLCVRGRQAELEKLSITGILGWNPESGLTDCLWVDPTYKPVLDEHGISYSENLFEYIIAHLESIIVQNLDLFVDSYFCEDYLFITASEVDKNTEASENVSLYTKKIREDSTLFILFNQVLKALVKEKVPILKKDVILAAFLENSQSNSEVNDLVQAIRLTLRDELPANKPKLFSIELPVDLEDSIIENLVQKEGKAFLSMLPEDCQETLTEIRNLIGSRPQQDTLLITRKSNLRIHLKKLIESEHPGVLVASQEELINIEP